MRRNFPFDPNYLQKHPVAKATQTSQMSGPSSGYLTAFFWIISWWLFFGYCGIWGSRCMRGTARIGLFASPSACRIFRIFRQSSEAALFSVLIWEFLKWFCIRDISSTLCISPIGRISRQAARRSSGIPRATRLPHRPSFQFVRRASAFRYRPH